jgi:lipid-binding SYLF domain-containing protein
MKYLLPIAAFAVTLFLNESLHAQTREASVVEESRQTLNEIMALPAKAIPESLLTNAQGIVIVPGLLKGGFIVGVRYGRGVVLVRDDNGAWRPPSFVSLTGGSVGYQIGVQSTDIIFVFKTRSSINGLLAGKFTVGADAAAAAGPVGREAAAATDGSLKAEILSYSRSRGLFAGVSLDGSVLQIDQTANSLYYGGANVTDPTQRIVVPGGGMALLRELTHYTQSPDTPASASLAAFNVPAGAPGAAGPTAIAGPQPTPAGTPPGASVSVGPGQSSTGQPATGQPIPIPQSSIQQRPMPQGALPQLPVAQGTSVAIPASPLTPAADLEAARRQLSDSSLRLYTVLDPSWKGYLAMPAEVYAGGNPPSFEAVQKTLQRFDTVAQDPRYGQLAGRSEFRTTHDWLVRYVGAVKRQGGQ